MPVTPMIPPIVTPIIHLNGDRAETLVAALEHAYTAVQEAIEALRQCAPNGRNYYPEPGLLERAQIQYSTRQTHLEAVRYSLQAEATAIQQGNAL